MQRWMTPAEVAELAQVPVRTVRYWRTIGEGPPSFRCGRHIRYKADDVRSWLEGMESAAHRTSA